MFRETLDRGVATSGPTVGVMGYTSGYIELSHRHDYPLLRQVLRCGFVAHSQLYEFMRLDNREHSRQSFNWRIRRLVTHHMVVRHTVQSFGRDFVYSIGPSGGERLRGMGEYGLFGRNNNEQLDREVNILHAVELNKIHLSLLNMYPQARWIPGSQVRSQNELTDFGYAKDYDAVIVLRLAAGERRFALEYERTAKARRNYVKIVRDLEAEKHVNQILYLAANYDLLRFVQRFFTEAHRPVYFGLVRDWHRLVLDMPVLGCHSSLPLPLHQVLR